MSDSAPETPERRGPKVLLLDDDEHFLELYQELLSAHLTCRPTVVTASLGVRALHLLEAEPFNLLILDLNMPKMDGLQVLCIARRKFPHLRLVVLTGVRDEQFRTRAYAMGVDQYWVKPESDQELGLFIESIDGLLQRQTQQGGFRGVQSKSLVDIIQLECLSLSSCVLKISNGAQEGKIWIQQGEIVDAEADGMTAEPAFQSILSWRTGSFEILPADFRRERAIFTSYQGLLLNTAQALDEAASQVPALSGPGAAAPEETSADTGEVSREGAVKSSLPEVEYMVALGTSPDAEPNSWGLDNPQPLAEWTHDTLARFEALNERLQVGPIQHILCAGPQRKVAIAPCGQTNLCVGFNSRLPVDQMVTYLRKVINAWGS